MNKREKYTNRQQLEEMVNLMKANQDIACGFSQRAPGEIKKFWDELALTLNGSGPPFKDAGGWRKVWTDYKSGVKKKLSKNKQLLTGTGGGPYKEIPLSEIEEEVSSFLKLNTAVYGMQNVSSFGVLKDSTSTENITSEEIETADENILANDNSNKENAENINFEQKKPRPLKRKRNEDKTELLSEQVSIQKKLAMDVAASLKHIENNNRENYRVMREIKRTIYSLSDEKKQQTKILLQQLEEQKRHNKEMMELLKKKIKLKEKILEIEITNINQQLK